MRIEGFYRNIKEANSAVEELKKAGFNNAAADINDHYTDERDVKTDLPARGDMVSLSDMVLGSGANVTDKSAGPLHAADPMVSGMAGFEEIADVNYKVIIEADEKDEKSIKDIIAKTGGSLDDPNVNRPKVTGNADTILERAIDRIAKDLSDY